MDTRRFSRAGNRCHFLSAFFSLLLMLLFLIGGLSPRAAWSRPGDLDPTFGDGGIVRAGRFCCGSGGANAVVLQPDGKLVAAGYAGGGPLALVRYLTDGSLDPSFGEGGKVLTIGEGLVGMAIAIQPDGKLVVAGEELDSQSGRRAFALVRYLPNGRLDESFGVGGKVMTALGSFGSYANALVIQPDGKLMAAGWSWVDNIAEMVLVRYQPDGAIDQSFGSGGKVFTTVKVPTPPSQIGLAFQTDGKLVVAGTLGSRDRHGISVTYAALIRYNPDGSRDPSFGPGGVVISPVGEQSRASISALVVQGDGKLVAAGSAFDGQNQGFALVRYHSDGNLDRNFGVDGQVILAREGENASATALLVQNDGKLVAGGLIYFNSGFGLARFNQDGSLDTNFGDQGRIFTAMDSRANPLTLQKDGKLVAVGSLQVSPDKRVFTLVRYNADGSPDSDFGDGGQVNTQVGLAYTYASSILTQADGKLVAAGVEYDGIQSSFALVRFNPNGSLDPGFGIAGQVLTSGEGLRSGVKDLLVQSDGKLVAIGSERGDGMPYGVTALVRYNPDAGLDLDFGVEGKVLLSYFYGHDMVLLPDGKLVVAGVGWDGTNNVLALARFNPDGGLDEGFGDQGKAMTSVVMDQVDDLVVQADGRLVAVGSVLVENKEIIVLARFNQNGRLHRSFGDQGIVQTQAGVFGGNPSALLVQTEGKLVVVGSSFQRIVDEDPISSFVLARYNPDGSLDVGFGDGGFVLTRVRYQNSSGDRFDAYANALLLQADGKLVAGGNFDRRDGFGYSWPIGSLLIRYNADGSLDQGFGDQGQVVTTFDDNGASIQAMRLQADGKLVTAGGSQGLFALARYCPDTCNAEPLERIDLSGQVRVSGSQIPVCAMVLANGKSHFSCDGTGRFHLSAVPLDANQQVTLYAWAEGFDPFKAIIRPQTATEYREVDLRVSACGQGPDPGNPPPGALSRVNLSGKVKLFGTNIPVCALVLANGESRFSCDGAGNYSLAAVPVDDTGLVTLYSWADGFIPFKAVIAPSQAAEIHDVLMRDRCNSAWKSGPSAPRPR